MSDQPTPGTALEPAGPPSPKALMQKWSGSFSAVLPSHIEKPEAWLRVAGAALKKGRPNRDNPRMTDLEVAATNNPAVFLSALLDAARLGLEPGTEQFYLTPRKVKNRLEILGIVGYQGLIELIYRAGAVSSVVAEVVHANDEFEWVAGALDTQDPPRWPGPQQRPYHRIDWRSTDRGPLVLTYAYATMKDGATSKVVVLGAADIARIKRSSQGASGDYSPWQTNPGAMWLKSAVRQLAKWVPTSAEYIIHQARAERVAAGEDAELPPMPEGYNLEERSASAIIDGDSQELGGDDDIVDGEVVS